MDAWTLRNVAAWEAHLAKWLHSHLSPLHADLGKAGFLVLAFPVAWSGYLWAAKLLGGRTLGQWLVPEPMKVRVGIGWATWRYVVMLLTFGVYESSVRVPPNWRFRHVAGSLCGSLIALYLCLTLALTMILWAEQR